MKKAILILLFPVLALGAGAVNFDSDAPGSAPRGWSVAMARKAGAPKWEVLVDRTAPSKSNVLAQTSNDPTGDRYPLCIYDESNLRDGEVSVAFKPVSGRVDQGAGLVWRYKDPNTYYIARANALEDNVVLYKVEKGARIPLAPKGTASSTYGAKHRVPSNAWSTLRVAFKGPLFTVYVNGQKVFDVEDATFTDAGKVGLWTKADSVIYFDNFEFK